MHTTVLTDLNGDEDEGYLWYEFTKMFLQQNIYEQLINIRPSGHGEYITYTYPGTVSYVSGTYEVVK